MLDSFVAHDNIPSSMDALTDPQGRFVATEPERRSAVAPSRIPDELPVSVQVSGTTFLGVYGVVGDTIELMSPDFGEAVTALGAEIAQAAAERLLRTIAGHEMETTGIPFMRDHRSGIGF